MDAATVVVVGGLIMCVAPRINWCANCLRSTADTAERETDGPAGLMGHRWELGHFFFNLSAALEKERKRLIA